MFCFAKDGTVVNPFKDRGAELVTLYSGDIMEPVIVCCLKEAPDIDKAMFIEFVRDSNRVPLYLMKGPNKLGSIRANATIFTKLFLSLVGRFGGDIDDVPPLSLSLSLSLSLYSHNIQLKFPSLRDQERKLTTATKSALLGCLSSMPDIVRSRSAKYPFVIVLNMLLVFILSSLIELHTLENTHTYASATLLR